MTKCNEFVLCLDGCYNMSPLIENIDTFKLGVTHIWYDEDNNILHVSLRRPGLLIGKGGSIINKIEELIGCDIHIHEVHTLWVLPHGVDKYITNKINKL